VPVAFVALIVPEKEPWVVGVPEIEPLEKLTLKPGGNPVPP